MPSDDVVFACRELILMCEVVRKRLGLPPWTPLGDLVRLLDDEKPPSASVSPPAALTRRARAAATAAIVRRLPAGAWLRKRGNAVVLAGGKRFTEKQAYDAVYEAFCRRRRTIVARAAARTRLIFAGGAVLCAQLLRGLVF